MKKIDIKLKDTVILSNQHFNKQLAGRIGFVIDKYMHDEEAEDKEWRYDIQFPFNPKSDKSEKDSHVFNQLQVGEEDITLLQAY